MTERSLPPSHPAEPVRFYTEQELDELEQTDPERAYRIARAQAMALRAAAPRAVPSGPPEPEQVREAVQGVRAILNRDGGDIELVGIEGSVVRVRMKGACAGCPHSVIDLRHVVQKIVGAVPGVTEVRNVF